MTQAKIIAQNPAQPALSTSAANAQPGTTATSNTRKLWLRKLRKTSEETKFQSSTVSSGGASRSARHAQKRPAVRAGFNEIVMIDRPASTAATAVISTTACTGGRQKDAIASEVIDATSMP